MECLVATGLRVEEGEGYRGDRDLAYPTGDGEVLDDLLASDIVGGDALLVALLRVVDLKGLGELELRSLSEL